MEQLKVKVAGGDEEAASAAAVDGEPVSPTGQYFNSSAMSISILAIFESDKPLDDSRAVATLEKLLLPISPRFSSVIIKCDKGIQHWKKVKISLVDHVKTPVFPAGVESYDEFVGEYLSNLAVERLPAGRPPWELHLLKYQTKTAAGTAVFKLHHALGDGFSLMGALFSCLKRADDPSLPLTFPSRQQSATPVKAGAVVQCCRALARALEVGVYTVVDFAGGILKSLLVEDDRTPVRSGEAGAEFRPLDISKVVFSLHDVRQIKIKIGGTINDVISGVIFYGTQLYIKAASHGHRSRGVGMGKVTLVLLLNTRSVNGYQCVEEMKGRGRKSSWGNQFGFIHVPVPKCKDVDTADPLSFVLKGRKIIRAKRNSLGVYLTGRMLEAIRKFRGSEAAAGYMYRTMRSSSMAVSNLIGPTEQMMMGNNPITDFYFMVVGGPQSLTITVVSYMGRLTVAMGTERGFIDSDLLRSSMQKSFQRIFHAAVNVKN